MSQTFTDDCFAAGHEGLTDLQNIEDNFHTLKTLFSGSSAPANSTGGMPWFDTGKKVLKIRNSTNGAWLGVLYASTVPRFWHYSNAAEDGWIVDSSIVDTVVAIKGGTAAYNRTGGGAAGTWTIAGLTVDAHWHNHTHQWYNHVDGAADDQSYNSAGSAINLSVSTKTEDYWHIGAYAATSPVGLGDLYTSVPTTSGGSTNTITCAATWRPSASVGTLQYLNL